jgi:hypothetical protein
LLGLDKNKGPAVGAFIILGTLPNLGVGFQNPDASALQPVRSNLVGVVTL